MTWPSITESCTSPRASSSASAWRMSSPTRNWRCEGRRLLLVSRWRRAMVVLVRDHRPPIMPPAQAGRMTSSHRGRSTLAGITGRPASAGMTAKRRRGRTAGVSNSQRALHRLHPIAFNDVTDLHVLVVLERHAALLAGNHFTRVVLEALELRELAFVDDHVVADQAHIGAALDHAIGYPAARHVADLGDLENLQDGRVAEHGLADGRRQQTRHRLLHVVHEIVDDVVVSDLDASPLGCLARLLVGAHVEADDHGA